MKKIYNSPAIETMVLGFSLMQTDSVSNNNAQGDPVFDPFNPAPRRRVF